MKNLKKIKYSAFVWVVMLFCFSVLACSSDQSGDDDGSATGGLGNLTVNVEIVGATPGNPGGDGSGVVNIKANAPNATSYKILINGDNFTNTNGQFTYTFTGNGTITRNAIVAAYKGTEVVSQTVAMTVTISSRLVWSDEFNTTGAPNSSFWTMETGNGESGWGNNELQYYTNRSENVFVSDGTLKINLKKESYEGFGYTSARMITKGKYSFKYGKIEFRAKLPIGKGTWPALWMLGSNIDTVPWPACGEIDVMEHVGNQQNIIHGTLHSPPFFGGNAQTKSVTIPDVSTAFHLYSMEWNASEIKFAVDGNVFYTVPNSASTPFNNNFFIIMNVAMGGNFGGTVDPAFVASTMEVDYVRVYQ